jgi:hypothetical protein
VDLLCFSQPRIEELDIISSGFKLPLSFGNYRVPAGLTLHLVCPAFQEPRFEKLPEGLNWSSLDLEF